MLGVASFLVEGAGTRGVDGTYTRTNVQCAGADVFRKASSSFAMLRRGTDDWCLVDLHSRSTTGWTLRCEELYRTSLGSAVWHTPPPMGWVEVVGQSPAPIVKVVKENYLSRSLVVTPSADGQTWPVLGASRGASLLAMAGSQSLSSLKMGTSSSTPTLPSIGGEPQPKPKAKPSSKGRGKETENFLCCFRVVLMRPSARVPWGFVWDSDIHERTGARVVDSILEGSPLSRWNFWQDLRGRPDLCVMEADQLLRVGGKWAFHDEEVGNQDGDLAQDAVEGRVGGRQEEPIVLDFARPTIRPPAPARPNLEVNDPTSTLVVDWSKSKGIHVRGWALCLQDVESGDWYAVDGLTSTAMPVNPMTNDVGVILPEDTSAWVPSAGLPSGRTYVACVAGLTNSGWTSFSHTSRPLSLPKFRNMFRELDQQPKGEQADELGRPRFAVPSRLVPGASAPVELVSGPREFLGRRRRLLLEMTLKAPAGEPAGAVKWGIRLHVGAEDTITVYRLEPGLAADRWCQSQQDAMFHGAAVPMRLCSGDVIASVNGLTRPGAILREVRNGPRALVLLVERETEGPGPSRHDAVEIEHMLPHEAGGEYELSPDSPDDEGRQDGGERFEDEESEIIRIHTRLDQDAAKAAEEVEWSVLLPQQEGKLATTMVGTEALKCEEMLKSMTTPSAYRSLFKEAEARVRLEHHRPKVAAIQALLQSKHKQIDEARGGADGEFFHRDKERVGRSKDDRILLALRYAMADANWNEKRLEDAIELFDSMASKDIRSSQAGLALIKRAQSLLKLWQWRRTCAQVRSELSAALEEVLREEAKGNPAVTDDPPYDLGALQKAAERARPYSSEFEFQFMEALEALTRLKVANARCMAQRKVEVIASDPKEHASNLEAAVKEAELVGVSAKLMAEVRKGMEESTKRKAEEECHDILFAAVQDLEAEMKHKTVPPSGTKEQRRVRDAVAGCGLPPDHYLVLKAEGLLKEWEKNNASLRSEVKLVNAEKRCKGFQLSEQSAGPTLASTIAEVSQQGADPELLARAKLTLQNWRLKQLQVCTQNLKTAIDAKSEEFLREAIRDAKTAGVPEAAVANANQQLMRLQMEEEVNTALVNAMESADPDLLESAIQQAHDGLFVEEESQALHSAVLQVHLRLWATEFNQVLKEKNIRGMDRYVPTAQDTIKQTRLALKGMSATTVNEAAIRTLERELRSLDLMLPKLEDFAAVRSAEGQLRRVLGAVEKYAQDLPHVISRAKVQVPKGLDTSLLKECTEHLKNYEETVKGLQSAMARPDVPAGELKSAVIKARLAGADMRLVEGGLEILSKRDPELHRYTNTQLELLLALTEADDIDELDVEGRFLRLQDAAEKAKRLSPPLGTDTMTEVDEVYLALAAEQSLKFAVRDGDAALVNRWAPTDEISACVGKLEQACLSAEQSALGTVKDTMLPRAQKLRDLLEAEADARLVTKARMREVFLDGPIQDLKLALRDAREAFVQENLLSGIYTELRKRKLEFITKDWRAARVAGNHQLSLAYWHRGVALEASKERSGEDWLQDHLPEMESKWTGGTTITGTFLKVGGGSFGSQTWRENPRYVVRPAAGAEASGGPIQVTLCAVEASPKLATLEVHAVQNKKQVALAGCGAVLMPGFEVLAASQPDKDLPLCSFELDPKSADSQPVFIVPSVAVGEEGDFKLLIEASEPVEVVDVGSAAKLNWRMVAEEEIEWSGTQPHCILMGGGRPLEGSPKLAWYRNPQFEVVYDGDGDGDEDKVDGGASDLSRTEEEAPMQPQMSDASSVFQGAGPVTKSGENPLLLVLLVPADKRCVHPAAIHLLRNKANEPSLGKSMTRRDLIEDQDGLVPNPWHHEMLASSRNSNGDDYSTDSELGAVCVVPQTDSEKIIVVPSLESRTAEATYKMQFFATTSVTVTRL